MTDDYAHLHVTREAGVCVATIDNPPINLMTLGLFAELGRLAEAVAADDEVRVLVLRSADPDFFIAHFDVEAILSFPVDAPARRSAELNDFHLLCRRLATMPKATICQIEGRVGGGGSELAMACDMRFGVRGRTRICQMEVPLGILPGGTGTQRLPRIVGRNRALEMILGGDDVDAETAEAWGWLNRALGADEIGPFVDGLARRIARFPAPAIAEAKACVDAAEGPLEEGCREEAYRFQKLIREPSARSAMARFLALGGQTRDGELAVGALAGRIADES